jgi:Tol biopolymer transport system component
MTGANQTRTQLQWLDRKGALLENVGEPVDYTYGGTPELSPDGKTSAMTIANRERGTSDVWLINLENGRRRRLTVDSVDHPAAIWHPGGRQVAVSTGVPGEPQFRMDIVSTEGALLHTYAFPMRMFYWPRSVHPDGRHLLYDAPDGAIVSGANIGVLDVQTDSTTIFVHGGDHITGLPQVSPDGRWVAYTSTESGRLEIYVAAYPSGGKYQVSQNGGNEPRWRADGIELFYVDAENYIVAAEVDAGASFEVASTTRLFQFHGAGGHWRYDVSNDGQRFLVTRALDEDLLSPVTIVTDWTGKVAAR